MGALAVVAIGLSTLYVVAAFMAPNPLLRILLRCVPFLPLAIWTIWFDASRPLEGRPPFLRAAGRLILFLATMIVVVLVLGLALNWLYDPNRVM